MAEHSNCSQNSQPSSCFCLGYAYVPIQQMDTVSCPAEALANGTAFPELVYTMHEYGKTCNETGGLL